MIKLKPFPVLGMFFILLTSISCDEGVIDQSGFIRVSLLSISDTPAINIANEESYPIRGTCIGTGEDASLVVRLNGTDLGEPLCVDSRWELTVDVSNHVSSIDDGNNVRITAIEGEGEVEREVLKDTERPVVNISSNSAINSLNQNNYVVSGTCPAEDDERPVVLSIGGLPDQSIDCMNGNWSLQSDVSSLTGGMITIVANMEDSAGNAADSVNVEVSRDIELPEVSITTTDFRINSSNKDNYLLGGTCSEEGVDVVIQIPGLSDNINVSCASMEWSFQGDVSDATEALGVEFSVQQSDAAGNIDTAEAMLDKDTMPPDVAVTSGVIINIGNQSNFQLSGTCSEQDQMVSVTIGAPPAVTASCDGTWSVPVDSNLSEGDVTLTITQVDSFGNERTLTPTLTKDITASQPAFDADLNIDGTNYLAYRASGTCPEDGRVNVTVDSNAAETVDCTGGTWQSSEYQFTPGETGTVTLRATLTDAAGNAGTEIMVDVSKNTNARMITIDTPAVINDANQNSYPVAGNCSAHMETVTVIVGGESPASAPTCTNGRWSTTVDVRTVNDNPSVAINVTFGSGGDMVQANDTVLKDASIPTVTITDPAAVTSNNEDSYSVSGTCVGADQQIQVSIGSITLNNVDCVSDGWSVTGQDLEDFTGANVRITANTTDIAGNVAVEAVEDVVRDVDPPVLTITTSNINIDRSNYQDYSIAGTCEGTEDVRITIGNLSEESVPCSSNNWSFANRNMTALGDAMGIAVVIRQDDAVENEGELNTTLDKDLTPAFPAFASGSSSTGTDSSITLDIGGSETLANYSFYSDNSCSSSLGSSVNGRQVTLTGFVLGQNTVYFTVMADTQCYQSVSYLYLRQISTYLDRIEIGSAHSCATKDDGGVGCWGEGDEGRLGNDLSSDREYAVAVVDGNSSTTPLSGIAQVSAGNSHTCALESDGGILCWGHGGAGRLGNDAESNRDHPVAVVDGDGSTTPLSGMVQVSAGLNHTCALKSDGGVLCWGNGEDGRLGSDASFDRDHPVAVVDGDGSTTPLSEIVQVSAGKNHTCAVKIDGRVVCWGNGASGRLGNDASSDRDHPVVVVDGNGSTNPLTGIVQVSAGFNHTCAVKSDGGIVCWGQGSFGRLGNDASSDRDHPVAVVDGDGSTTPLSGVVQVSAGSYHTCATKSDGEAVCWGYGANRSLGNGGTSTRDHPVSVIDGNGSTTPLSGVVQVSAGAYHACAMKDDGDVVCWGFGGQGRLGNDAFSTVGYPVTVVDGDGSSTAFDTGSTSPGSHTCTDNGSTFSCSID